MNSWRCLLVHQNASLEERPFCIQAMLVVVACMCGNALLSSERTCFVHLTALHPSMPKSIASSLSIFALSLHRTILHPHFLHPPLPPQPWLPCTFQESGLSPMAGSDPADATADVTGEGLMHAVTRSRNGSVLCRRTILKLSLFPGLLQAQAQGQIGRGQRQGERAGEGEREGEGAPRQAQAHGGGEGGVAIQGQGQADGPAEGDQQQHQHQHQQWMPGGFVPIPYAPNYFEVSEQQQGCLAEACAVCRRCSETPVVEFTVTRGFNVLFLHPLVVGLLTSSRWQATCVQRRALKTVAARPVSLTGQTTSHALLAGLHHGALNSTSPRQTLVPAPYTFLQVFIKSFFSFTPTSGSWVPRE